MASLKLPLNLTDVKDPFDGILAYLVKCFPDDYMTYISTTASTNSDTAFWPLEPDKYEHSWYTLMEQTTPQWYQLELKNTIIDITSYSLRSSGSVKGSPYHLLGWSLYGSNNGVRWNLIDEKTTETLNKINGYSNFPAKYPGTYRFFRLLQTKQNSDSSYGFSMRRIELFGILSKYMPSALQMLPVPSLFIDMQLILFLQLF